MQAVVMNQPGQMVVVDVPVPKPGDYKALCRIEFGATCTGTDQHLIAGRFPWLVPYPTIPQHESIASKMVKAVICCALLNMPYHPETIAP